MCSKQTWKLLHVYNNKKAETVCEYQLWITASLRIIYKSVSQFTGKLLGDYK